MVANPTPQDNEQDESLSEGEPRSFWKNPFFEYVKALILCKQKQPDSLELITELKGYHKGRADANRYNRTFAFLAAVTAGIVTLLVGSGAIKLVTQAANSSATHDAGVIGTAVVFAVDDILPEVVIDSAKSLGIEPADIDLLPDAVANIARNKLREKVLQNTELDELPFDDQFGDALLSTIWAILAIQVGMILLLSFYWFLRRKAECDVDFHLMNLIQLEPDNFMPTAKSFGEDE